MNSELDFSRFHPLDHRPGGARCRSLYGGTRNHLVMAWQFKWSARLRELTLCRLGWHERCTATSYNSDGTERKRQACWSCGADLRCRHRWIYGQLDGEIVEHCQLCSVEAPDRGVKVHAWLRKHHLPRIHGCIWDRHCRFWCPCARVSLYWGPLSVDVELPGYWVGMDLDFETHIAVRRRMWERGHVSCHWRQQRWH
jgi:hypothetical protein